MPELGIDRMADRPAVHMNVPLVDLPMYISKGDVRLRCNDAGACIGRLRIDINVPGVRTVVKKAHETLSYLALPILQAYGRLVGDSVVTRISLLLITALVFLVAVIAQDQLIVSGLDAVAGQFVVRILSSRDGPLSTGVRSWGVVMGALAAVLVAMIGVVVGPWLCGRGSAAWAVSRLTVGRRGPDGPRGWPVLGSWWLMQGSAMHRDLAKLAWDGGTSTRELMALRVGATRIVVSSDPEVAKQILQSQVFGDRPLKQAACSLGFARAIGFAPQGPYWRHLRKTAVTHMFARKQLAARFELVQRESSRMVSAIASDLARGSNTGLRIRPYLQRAAVNNITTSVFGRHFSFGSRSPCAIEAEALEGMIREGFELLGAFNSADHLPLLRHLRFLPIASRCHRLAARVRQFVQPIIEERRGHLAGDSGRSTTTSTSWSFVDALLALEGDQKLPNDDMISVLWEMVFRGTDTIAVLTEWALAEVILNPRIQRRIQEELDVAVLGRQDQDRLGVFQGLSDIDQLPYLQAVVKETLRAHPPGPLLSWARLASEDTQVAGHHVPKGTTAMVNMWAITHDPTIWPNPDVFDPERFVKVGSGVDEIQQLDVLGTDLRLAPFGSGRRVCPGRALGVATAQLWLASLLHQFSWSQDPNHPIVLTDNLKLSCEMASPLRACAVARIPQRLV